MRRVLAAALLPALLAASGAARAAADCEDSVQQQQQQMRTDYVQEKSTLAQALYSRMDGTGGSGTGGSGATPKTVSAAPGGGSLSGLGSSLTSQLSGSLGGLNGLIDGRSMDGFSGLSCLDRIMNTGADIFFEPPSLDGLLNMIMKQGCQQVTQIFSSVTQPFQQRMSLPLGEVAPGVNLGSMSGGIRISQGGSSGGGLTTANVRSMLPAYNQRVRLPRDAGLTSFFGNSR